MVKICPSCTWANDDFSTYCTSCGTNLIGPILREVDVPYPPLVPRAIPLIASCTYHTAIPALASCFICRRPICVNCIRGQGGVSLCLECAARAPHSIPVMGVLPPTYYPYARYR